jgi:hypothetical protein
VELPWNLCKESVKNGGEMVPNIIQNMVKRWGILVKSVPITVDFTVKYLGSWWGREAIAKWCQPIFPP